MLQAVYSQTVKNFDGVVHFVERQAINEKNWLYYIPVAENFQEKLKKFVDEGLDSNGPSSKPYREISNSTRELRLEQDATGNVIVRVVIQPPKPRAGQKSAVQLPRDRLLLNRHQTIHLIIKKAIQYRIDHNGSSVSINQMQKELKRTYFISTETIAYVLSQINSPEQDLFTIEANPPLLSTQQQQTDINKKNNKNDDSGDKNGVDRLIKYTGYGNAAGWLYDFG
ncbi:unnamed protein product [Didymodactylos carnosus]|uniref:Uncharacterized protein n=1 Tax=Didymodactylos carnosus TaxID=1234261 RepID=A0A815EXY8_9BILA|nr:unnamed protein product [Didymodactylos carnosus]CAF4161986.1 unnamed protein product [Didymodactylos carnosus]